MAKEEKDKIIKLKSVMADFRSKLGKKSGKPLKLIKLSSLPGIITKIKRD